MKKLILMVFIIVLFAATAIIVYAQTSADTGTVARLPLVYTHPNAVQSAEDDFCGLTPQVFELNGGDGNPIGHLSVSNDRHNLYFAYQVSDGLCLAASDLEVTTSLAGIPQENGSPLPDSFTYQNQQAQCIQHQVYVVPMPEIFKFSEKLYFAARAITQNPQGGEAEDGWTTCFPFPAEDGTGYCTYAPRFEENKPVSLAVGFEDLMLTDSIDFDYNDWMTDLGGTINYCRTYTQRLGLHSIEFDISPEARGAALDHVFHLRFPANTFLSDGVSTLTIWDQNGNVVGGHSDQPFLASAENDFSVIEPTSLAFPGAVVNTRESLPHITTQRTARLTIVFDEILPFDFTPSDPTLPENVHGANLLFDPYLFVLRSGIPSYGIHRGDDRMLILPSSELRWAEERIPVWEAYPDVIPGDRTVTPMVPPTFPGSWWLNYNNCVYDGVPCAVPPVTSLDGSAIPITTPVSSPVP